MTTLTRSTAPVDPVGVDLTRTLRALKLGGMTGSSHLGWGLVESAGDQEHA